MSPVLPVQVVVGLHQLRSSKSRELCPVDIVVLDPLLAQTDHLEANVLSLSITVQPQSKILSLAGQLLTIRSIFTVSQQSTTRQYLQMLHYPQFLGRVLHDLLSFGIEQLGQISHTPVLRINKSLISQPTIAGMWSDLPRS